MSLLHSGESELQYVADARRQFETPEQASFPATQSEIPKQMGGTVLRFVFWTHTSENYQDMTAALDGCDVIAVEAVSDAETTDEESIDRAQQDSDRIWAVINNKSVLKAETVDDAWSVFEYVGACPTADRYYPLDVEPAHTSEYRELESAKDKAFSDFIDAVVDENGYSWSMLEEYVDNLVHHQSAKTAFRENIVAEQLKAIIAAHPGKTIGVLYGRAHLTLPRLLDGIEGLSMQRSVRKESVLTEPTGSADFIYEHAYRAGIVPIYERNSMIIETLAIKYGIQNEYVAHEFNYELIANVASKLMAVMQEPINKHDPSFEKRVQEQEAQVKGILVAALVFPVQDHQKA